MPFRFNVRHERICWQFSSRRYDRERDIKPSDTRLQTAGLGRLFGERRNNRAVVSYSDPCQLCFWRKPLGACFCCCNSPLGYRRMVSRSFPSTVRRRIPTASPAFFWRHRQSIGLGRRRADGVDDAHRGLKLTGSLVPGRSGAGFGLDAKTKGNKEDGILHGRLFITHAR